MGREGERVTKKPLDFFRLKRNDPATAWPLHPLL
jgi:hypothetical protein